MNKFFWWRRKKGPECAEIMTVLQNYLDSELDPDQVPEVLAHLEHCRDCGLEAEIYEDIKASLRKLRVDPEPDQVARLRASAERLAATGNLD